MISKHLPPADVTSHNRLLAVSKELYLQKNRITRCNQSKVAYKQVSLNGLIPILSDIKGCPSWPITGIRPSRFVALLLNYATHVLDLDLLSARCRISVSQVIIYLR